MCTKENIKQIFLKEMELYHIITKENTLVNLKTVKKQVKAKKYTKMVTFMRETTKQIKETELDIIQQSKISNIKVILKMDTDMEKVLHSTQVKMQLMSENLDETKNMV